MPNIVETRESLENLLSYPDTEELFHDLVAKYALRSGISEVQPKVMLDATEKGTTAVGGYIIKPWGRDYPQLAANEYLCMTAAKRAGLPVPALPIGRVGQIFEEVAEAVTSTRDLLSTYTADHPEFSEIGDKMLRAGHTGVTDLDIKSP